MKKIIFQWWPLLAFVFFTLFYYSNLFYPRLSVFFTPDLGRSDILHTYSLLSIYSERLKNLQIPLWTNLLGTGVPLATSGMIDFSSLIRLITSYFFPHPVAFNLYFLLHCLLALFGMYLLGRYFKFSRFTCVFVAVIFSFSGFFIARITHSSVFSGAVFMPLVFLFSIRLLEKGRLQDGLVLAFFVNQQIFSGHIQFFFITLVGVLLTSVFLIVVDNKNHHIKFKNFLYLILAILFGSLLAAIHILPMFEYKSYSVRNLGLDFEKATTNSLTPQFFLTLVYPFIFGNPANGSYQLYNNGGWDIFWEKMGYIGLIPLVFIFMAFFSRKTNPPYKKTVILLLIFSILFGLGKYSPLFFVYFFPPFNFFQIPARFILLITFSLSLLAGFGMEEFLKKKTRTVTIKTILLLLVFLPSWLIYLSYQLVIPVQEAIKPPAAYLVIQKKPGRIVQLGAGWPYLQQLSRFGWQDPSYYLFAKNSLDTDISALYRIPQVGIYFSLLTKRQNLIQNLLVNEARGDFNNLTASLNPLYKKILNIASTRFLISPFKISDNRLILLKTIIPNKKNWPSFYIYENLDVFPRFRLVNDYKKADNEETSLTIFRQKGFNPKTTAVIENGPLKEFQKATIKEINISKDENEEIILDIKVNNENILIMADSYVPGWQAFIDNKETKIYPANINQRAIIIPAGKHGVRFIYQPQSIRLGMKISLIAYIVWILLLIKTYLSSANHGSGSAPPLFQG